MTAPSYVPMQLMPCSVPTLAIFWRWGSEDDVRLIELPVYGFAILHHQEDQSQSIEPLVIESGSLLPALNVEGKYFLGCETKAAYQSSLWLDLAYDHATEIANAAEAAGKPN